MLLILPKDRRAARISMAILYSFCITHIFNMINKNLFSRPTFLHFADMLNQTDTSSPSKSLLRPSPLSFCVQNLKQKGTVKSLCIYKLYE